MWTRKTRLSPKLYVYNTSAPVFTGCRPMVMAVYPGSKQYDSATFLCSDPNASGDRRRRTRNPRRGR